MLTIQYLASREPCRCLFNEPTDNISQHQKTVTNPRRVLQHFCFAPHRNPPAAFMKKGCLKASLSEGLIANMCFKLAQALSLSTTTHSRRVYRVNAWARVTRSWMSFLTHLPSNKAVFYIVALRWGKSRRRSRCATFTSIEENNRCHSW